MKKLLVVSALLLSSTTLFSTANAQQVRFVSSDGSDLSALCIAVATSNLPLSETLATYGIERKETHQNGGSFEMCFAFGFGSFPS